MNTSSRTPIRQPTRQQPATRVHRADCIVGTVGTIGFVVMVFIHLMEYFA